MCVVRSVDIARVLAILGAGGKETHIAAAGSRLIIFSPDGFGGLSTEDMQTLADCGWVWDSFLDYEGGTGGWKLCQCKEESWV